MPHALSRMRCATLAEFTMRGAGDSWVATEANDGDGVAISDDVEAVGFKDGVETSMLVVGSPS